VRSGNHRRAGVNGAPLKFNPPFERNPACPPLGHGASSVSTSGHFLFITKRTPSPCPPRPPVKHPGTRGQVSHPHGVITNRHASCRWAPRPPSRGSAPIISHTQAPQGAANTPNTCTLQPGEAVVRSRRLHRFMGCPGSCSRLGRVLRCQPGALIASTTQGNPLPRDGASITHLTAGALHGIFRCWGRCGDWPLTSATSYGAQRSRSGRGPAGAQQDGWSAVRFVKPCRPKALLRHRPGVSYPSCDPSPGQWRPWTCRAIANRRVMRR